MFYSFWSFVSWFSWLVCWFHVFGCLVASFKSFRFNNSYQETKEEWWKQVTTWKIQLGRADNDGSLLCAEEAVAKSAGAVPLLRAITLQASAHVTLSSEKTIAVLMGPQGEPKRNKFLDELKDMHKEHSGISSLSPRTPPPPLPPAAAHQSHTKRSRCWVELELSVFVFRWNEGYGRVESHSSVYKGEFPFKRGSHAYFQVKVTLSLFCF